MKILFDFEIDKTLRHPSENTTFLVAEIRKFLHERFRLLEDKIDNLQGKNDVALVVVTIEDEALLFHFHNIPKPLSDKLLETVGTDDLNYLMQSIERKITGD